MFMKSSAGAKVLKPFHFATDAASKKARVFVTGW
jgi:hypothetical protein